MASYRIFQLREDYVQAFQDRAPKAGTISLRDSRYDEVGVVNADTPYEAWLILRQETRDDAVRELGVGDVLQLGDDAPMVCTWWGFDRAAWMSVAQEAAEKKQPEGAVQVPA